MVVCRTITTIDLLSWIVLLFPLPVPCHHGHHGNRHQHRRYRLGRRRCLSAVVVIAYTVAIAASITISSFSWRYVSFWVHLYKKVVSFFCLRTATAKLSAEGLETTF
jgi:hypothetical protein